MNSKLLEFLMAFLVAVFYTCVMNATGWKLSDWKWWIFLFLLLTLIILCAEVLYFKRIR